jgi:TIR domain-containing protein
LILLAICYKHFAPSGAKTSESKVKVFISWSGQRSAAVADALRYWLPKVIQSLEPWMSADDIEKGTRWRSGLATELEQSRVGIICLTQENLDSTWLHFEAGALSKQQDNTLVCTFLFGLEPTDVREPLAQFQATRALKDDVRKLVSTINSTLGAAKLQESELNESFEVWWSKLDERLKGITETATSTAPVRSDRDLLEEILEIVRSQPSRLALSLGTGLKPRLPSTLDWSPEDARLVTDYVDKYRATPSENKLLVDMLNRVSNDEVVARTLLRILKRAPKEQDGVDSENPEEPK